MKTIGIDIKYALRKLTKAPGFTAVALVSLALGIGANTAVFSLLNAVLFKSLPVSDPQALRLIQWRGIRPEFQGYTGNGMLQEPGGYQTGESFSYPAYRQIREHSAGMAEVFTFFPLYQVATQGTGEVSTGDGLMVSGNFFAGYGGQAQIGRLIDPSHDRPDAANVVVITHRLWERRFGSDPNIIGSRVLLNRKPFVLLGVLGKDYAGPLPGDPSLFYVPMAAQPLLVPYRSLESPRRWWVQVMSRLKGGIDERKYQASLSVLFRRILTESGARMERPEILLQDGSRGSMMVRRPLAEPLYLLLAVVGLVLLIACTNLSGLLLVRSAERERELAVCSALGAGRGRLIRQTLMESLLLSMIGGALGWIVALWGRAAFLGFLQTFSEDFRLDLRTDLRVLGFTFFLALGTSLIFGVLPAIRNSRIDPMIGLKNRTTLGIYRHRWSKLLVSVQVGLSLVLVIGAGLMLRTFTNLTRIDPGFQPENLLLFRIDVTQAGLKEEALSAFFDRIRQSIRETPGVRSTTISSQILVSGETYMEGIEIPGQVAPKDAPAQAAVITAGEGFFSSMGIALLSGREFSTTDTPGRQPVAIVNETFARRFFPGQNPIGLTFTMQDGRGKQIAIVGLCRDTRYESIRTSIPPTLFLPFSQRSQGMAVFAVRTASAPLSLLPAIRKKIAALDPQLPLTDVTTQEQVLARSLSRERLFAVMGSGLAMLAVGLSCIGLFGLMSFRVQRRGGEIGLRMALGADPDKVIRQILGETFRYTGIGVAIGIPVAIAIAGTIRGFWFGVSDYDPLTILAGTGLLLGVALLAGWIPARRAARIDPVRALRSEL